MKKSTLIFILLIWIISIPHMFAQDKQRIDSLKRLISKTDSESDKVDFLVKISANYRSTDLNKALANIEEALKIAKEIKDTSRILLCIEYKGGIIEDLGQNQEAINVLSKGLSLAQKYGNKEILSDYYLKVGWLYEFTADYDMALDFFKKRLQIKKDLKDKEGISITHNYLGIIYEEMGEYNNAIIELKKSLRIAKEINNSELMSHAYNNIGLVYDYQGKNDSALIFYNKSVEIERRDNDKQGIADGLVNIGTVYQEMGNFKRAIDLFNEGLAIYAEIEYEYGVAMSINNLGEVHMQLGNYDIALKYFRESLKYDKKSGNKDEIAISLMNVGDAFIHLKHYDSAFHYLNSSLEISSLIDDKSNIANTLSSIGSLYMEQKEYKTALQKYTQVLELHESLGEKDRISYDLIKIGEIYFHLNNYKEAEKNINKGLKIALKNDFKEDIKIAAELLSKIYAEVRDFERAYINHVLFKKMYDSIFTLESTKKLSALETRFELEKKEQEIERQNAKIAQQRKQQIILGIGFFIVLIAVIIALFFYRKIKKAKNIIDYQRHEIMESNEELRQINEEIRTTLETVNSQKEEIETQRDKIELANEELTAGIRYAKYIQKAILPGSEKRNKLFKNHFVFFKPKQIVSGDFYWINEIKNKIIIAASDCTGHGVPGAFMSLLGISFLNDVVNREGLTNPAMILDRLREEVINALHQKGTPGEARDGMDVAICTIDLNNMQLQFAGANNPIYIIRSNTLEKIENSSKTDSESHILYDIKGDKTTIAYRNNMKSFTTKEIKLFEGDRLYLFTDGYRDQFGEGSGKKLGSQRFKKLLLKHSDKAMKEQGEILESTFDEWKGEYDHIDDVLVLGIEL
jgi:tetratricopeptide (TPR) repeat protein